MKTIYFVRQSYTNWERTRAKSLLAAKVVATQRYGKRCTTGLEVGMMNEKTLPEILTLSTKEPGRIWRNVPEADAGEPAPLSIAEQLAIVNKFIAENP